MSGVATDPLYLDIAVPAGTWFAVPLPAAHNAFAYVFEGAGKIAAEQVARGELAVLGAGSGSRSTPDRRARGSS